jgi:hypothetical protein
MLGMITHEEMGLGRDCDVGIARKSSNGCPIGTMARREVRDRYGSALSSSMLSKCSLVGGVLEREGGATVKVKVARELDVWQ